MSQDRDHILNEPGKISENIYHIDLKQYGQSRITSAFCYWDGDVGLLMDCGTSNDVGKVHRFLRKKQIPTEKIVGICGSHYHFDHMGGATTLWKKYSKKNPEFKIIVPQDTHDKLQNASEHLKGAKTTFGDFVGKMPSAPPEAYQIVQKDEPIPLDLKNNRSITLVSTPGHSPDHCSPTLKEVRRSRDRVEFCFTGEACGSIFHSSKIVSVPTSMPPNYDSEKYKNNFDLFLDMDPEIVGFCHFGAIKGKKPIKSFVNEHKQLMETMKAEIIKAYREKSSTKHVMKETRKLWNGRFDERLTDDGMSKQFLDNLRLALTYGQLIDLGFRKPKYERKQAQIRKEARNNN